MEELVVIQRSELERILKVAVKEAMKEIMGQKTSERKGGSERRMGMDEAVDYLNRSGLSVAKSTIYKLTSTNEIPFRRFGGRKIVFNADELDEWAEGQLGKKRNAVAEAVARSARKKI